MCVDGILVQRNTNSSSLWHSFTHMIISHALRLKCCRFIVLYLCAFCQNSLFCQIGNRVLYIFFTHVRELFGDVVLKQVVRPLRWSNMATMPALPETQESIKEEIRRQVGSVLRLHMKPLRNGWIGKKIKGQIFIND